jgi:ligand-binding sensor domain-containing protein
MKPKIHEHHKKSNIAVTKQVLSFSLALALAVLANAQTFTNYTIDSGLVNNNVLCVDVAAGDVMWFGTQEGVSVYDGITWATHTTSTDSGLVHNTIQAICVLDNGNVWVGTDFGACLFDGSNWTTFDESDGLGDNRVRHIAEDAGGGVWFGHNDGVSVLQGTTWTSYGMADGLPFGGVTYVNFDNNGDKWLGTGLGGVAVFDDVDFTLITEQERLINDKVRAIGIDAGGNKWIGTADGVSVYNPDDYLVEQHTIMLVLPPPDTLNPVEDLKIAGNGNIWAGIYIDYLVTEGGVAMFNGNDWTYYDVSDGLVGPVIRSIGIDSQDNVWVTTSTGISKISDVPPDSMNYWSTWDNSPAYPEDTITTSIIAAKETAGGLVAYPVPALSIITISSTFNSAIEQVEIISIHGQVLKSLAGSGQATLQVSLEDIAPGFYLARVHLVDQIEVVSFVKN